MTDQFAHEKLKVYQAALTFAVGRGDLLAGLARRVSACDHLDRGAESILLNIAHASSSWSPKERIVYLGHANGSALECAACLDVFVAKELLTADDVHSSKALLAEIVSMLIAMRRTTADRVRENHTVYQTKKGLMFSHEDLDVYQVALQLVAWMDNMNTHFSCSADLLSKLDKSTTSIALNIAEGSGRFTDTDQAKFFGIAYRSTVQSASLLDIASSSIAMRPPQLEDGRSMLRRIAAMLASLSKGSSRDS